MFVLKREATDNIQITRVRSVPESSFMSTNKAIGDQKFLNLSVSFEEKALIVCLLTVLWALFTFGRALLNSAVQNI